jgi:major membrane immunogen (membrane-anchored lipoprotein)
VRDYHQLKTTRRKQLQDPATKQWAATHVQESNSESRAQERDQLREKDVRAADQEKVDVVAGAAAAAEAFLGALLPARLGRAVLPCAVSIRFVCVVLSDHECIALRDR